MLWVSSLKKAQNGTCPFALANLTCSILLMEHLFLFALGTSPDGPYYNGKRQPHWCSEHRPLDKKENQIPYNG